MSILLPAASLKPPVVSVLNAGAVVHRVHSSAFSHASFNPCLGGQTRFAPIHDDNGDCVPSIYAGSTLASAIHETIFHDIAAKATFKTVPKQVLMLKTHSKLLLTRNVTLAVLTNKTLGRWNITRRDLIESSAKLYSQTARWAEEIYRQHPHIDGLVWTSKQCDPDSAYLFFGNRLSDGDFSLNAQRDGKQDAGFIRDVIYEGRLRGITIVV